MDYPLEFRFKLLALAPQIQVKDAGGALRMHVRQKLFKLKEAVTVFADEQQQVQLARIEADRILDFNARYRFTSATGESLGEVRRKGARSLWRAHYEIHGADGLLFTLEERNPWAKVGDGLLSDVPIVGLFSGFVFHPSYAVKRPDGAEVLRITKRIAFFEGRFSVERLSALSTDEESAALLATLMMLLLERQRG